MMDEAATPLHFTTWLSPGLPLELFGVTGFGPVTHDDYARLGPIVERANALVPNS